MHFLAVPQVVRREELLHNRLHLSYYDKDQDGYLTLLDLREYVQEVVCSLPQLDNLPGFADFLPYYTHTAVCKFFFFLDPLHMQKIRIRDLACSLEFAELSELRQAGAEENENASPCYGGNWFDPQFAMDLYRWARDPKSTYQPGCFA